MRIQIKTALALGFSLLLLLLDGVPAKPHSPVTAAVLPGLGNIFNNADDKKGSNNRRPPPNEVPPPIRPPPPTASNEQRRYHQRVGVEQKPPPPPPPPIASLPDAAKKEGEEENEDVDDEDDVTQDPWVDAEGKPLQDYSQNDLLMQQQQQQQQQHMPPQYWGGHQYEHQYGMVPPTHPGWMGPPPPEDWGHHHHQQQQPPPSAWQQQQQQQQQQQDIVYHEDGDTENMERMRQELDESVSRETELLQEIQNLTAAVATFEQREDLHLRQLDVLTERVMDTEADLATARNLALEYQANCTEMGRSLELVQEDMDEWKELCANLSTIHDADEDQIAELQQTLRERTDELENLATIVEKSRLLDERDRYLAERKKRKKRGFFAWLFGLGDDEESDQDRLQELAKSTLLRALQTERNSVHELEAALTTLQQNNSAISEMVESRDTLINELNDRVAVFEEDKLVLKAALRQLQKEMREEAPKTKKLHDDLQTAREEIERLKGEIDSIIEMHSDEVALLQQTISTKQIAINETESNLTVIGTYVDKLEERLATFAIARRDIEIREDKCNKVEELAQALEIERDELKQEVAKYATEHDELKGLLDELVTERTRLNKDKQQLALERDDLFSEGKRLRECIASLENDVGGLDEALEEWRTKVAELEGIIQDQSSQLQNYVVQQEEQLMKGQQEEIEWTQQLEKRKDVQLQLEHQLREAAERIQQLEISLREQEELVELSRMESKEPDDDVNITVVANDKTNDATEDVQTPTAVAAEGTDDGEAKNVPLASDPPRAINVTSTLTPGPPQLPGADDEKPRPPLPGADDEKPSDPKLPPPLPGADDEKPSDPKVPPPLPGADDEKPSDPRLPKGPPPKKGQKVPPGHKSKLVRPKHLPPGGKRNVPFRQIRKAFAKATGVRGLFTPPSQSRLPPKRRPLPAKLAGSKQVLPKKVPPAPKKAKKQL